MAPILCALAVAILLVGFVQAYVGARLPANLPFYAAHAMSFKVNGNALQAAAFHAPNELPIYGSSELDRWVDHRADSFFAARPTGFAVFPVGRGGATCFLIAQKLAAVGRAARGKKVVIFLSPSWFLIPGVGGDAVAANLGMAQLSAWLFGDELSPALKTDLARRMRDFPDTLKDQSLLADAVRCLADPTPLSRLYFAFLHPLGRLQNVLLERFDHGVILWELVFPQTRWYRAEKHGQVKPPLSGGHIDWDRLLPNAGADSQAPGLPAAAAGADLRDANEAQPSEEFTDLALLLRVLEELQMRALFISQPLHDIPGDGSRSTVRNRRAYHARLQTMLHTAGYPLRDFSGHEGDPTFFSDDVHPSAKAWLFYDQTIDDFYASSPDKS